MSDSIYQKIYSIYTVTCLINNMIYVGFTDNFERRKKQHIYHAFKRNSIFYLHCSMRKYGIENFVFEVIYQSKNGEDCLKYWENYFILKFNSLAPSGYNLTLGGDGLIGYKRTEEHTKKISNANTGKKRTEEQRKLMSDAMMGDKNPNFGKPKSEETKKKMSISKTGIKNYNYGKIPWNKGIPQTEEHRRKNREAKLGIKNPNFGKPKSEETKKKMSISRKETWRRKKELNTIDS